MKRIALVLLVTGLSPLLVPLSYVAGITPALAAGVTYVNDTFATTPADVNFNGSAFYSSGDQAGVLTQAFHGGQAGSIFTKTAFSLTDFSTTFQFRTFAGPIGVRADGFAFVIQQVGNTAVGVNGSGLGYAGLGGYGAIFRTYNLAECGNGGGGNYVGVATGTCSVSSFVTVFAQHGAFSVLNDTSWHTAVVKVAFGQMSIFIDGAPYLSNIALPGYTGGQQYYLGFTGGTGGLSETAEVRNWTAWQTLRTTTALASSANPSASGQPVTFTATVAPSSGSGTPTGTIQFSIDGASFGSPVSLNGSGQATSGPISSLAPGNHTITAAYSGDANFLESTVNLTQTVNVSHLAGSLASSFRPAEGHLFSGAVATFTDSNTFISASQLTATISWGDGTSSAGTVSGSAGHFTVSGSHAYADEGRVSVSVTLQEQTPGHASGTASGTVPVTEADVLSPASSSLAPATASQTYAGPVASFTDSNTANIASDFSATINWGDGTTSAGTISGSAGHLTVSGSHTYALPGQYTIQTTIRDDAPGTATAMATSTLLVMAPGSSKGSTVTAYGTGSCTSVASSTTVSATGSASGTFSLRDERPGGTPCGPYRPGVLTLQAVTITAVVCTSHTTATIYGSARQGTYPNTTAQTVSFRADVAITSQSSPFNGTVSVQTSSGYASGALPAAVRITGC